MNTRSLRFSKMHGLGNDFVVIDGVRQPVTLDADLVRRLGDRHFGVGFDQLLLVEPPTRPGMDFRYRIWNADGGEVDACGNATRCVAWLLMEEGGAASRRIETPAGMLYAERAGERVITVDMGSPLLRWEEIPLARAMPTDRMDFAVEGFEAPGAVNMGNPHVVFFVDDVSTVPIETLGPRIEHDPLFPKQVNVGFAEVRSPTQIRLRVWERGTGLTKACGTGACAAVVAAHRQGRTERKVEVLVDGGSLEIEWRAGDDRVLMTGPVELEATGELPAA